MNSQTDIHGKVLRMFRQAAGYRTQYGSLMLYVASDFDEWRIEALGPKTIIRGGREFSEDKAKAQALQIAGEYFAEHGEEPPDAGAEWVALEPGDWLNWRG